MIQKKKRNNKKEKKKQRKQFSCSITSTLCLNTGRVLQKFHIYLSSRENNESHHRSAHKAALHTHLVQKKLGGELNHGKRNKKEADHVREFGSILHMDICEFHIEVLIHGMKRPLQKKRKVGPSLERSITHSEQ